MTQAGGFDVDHDALRAVAEAARAVAPDAGQVDGLVERATEQLTTAVPGSRSAEVLRQQAPAWREGLRRHAADLQVVAGRLDETAARYAEADQQVSRVLGGGSGPHAG